MGGATNDHTTGTGDLQALVEEEISNLSDIDETEEIEHPVSIGNEDEGDSSMQGDSFMQGGSSTESSVCDGCGQQFTDASMLHVHAQGCIFDTDVVLTDSKNLVISSESMSLAQLKSDIESVAVSEQEGYSADDGSTTLTKGSNKRPGKSSGFGDYSCSECDRRFQWASHLHAHMRRHTDARPFECTVCGRRFRDNCLSTHMLTHTNARPHECVQCGKTFSRSADLAVHLKAHTGAKAHICDSCERGFVKKGDLARHKRVHTGERPYICEECGKAFKILFHLRLHASVHSAIRGHACELCPKAFGNVTQLRKHIQVHSGERPHACDICSRRFNRAANLRAHMKVHEVRLAPHRGTASIDVGQIEEDYNNGGGDLVYCKVEPSEEHDVLLALPCDSSSVWSY